MNETTAQILFGFVAPVIVAGVLVWPGRRGPDDERTKRARGAWRLPVAIGGPVVLAFLALYGWPSEQWTHVVFAAAAGVVVGVVTALTPRAAWARVMLAAVLGLLVVLAIWPVVQREVGGYRLWPGLMTVLVLLALDPVARRRPGPGLPALLWLVMAVTTSIVLISGFLKLTVALAPVPVALAMIAVIAAVRRQPRGLGDGGLAPVVPMLVVGPFVAWLYMTSSGGGVPDACFVLPLLAAPAAAWAGEIPALRKRSPALAGAIAWLVAIVLCGAALGLALRGPAGDDGPVDPYEQMYQDMMGG